MIHEVSGSDSTTSTEAKSGYRGILDQSLTETSGSSESSAASAGKFGDDLHTSYELGCVGGTYHLAGSDIDESVEYNGTTGHAYISPVAGEIGSQPGYNFTVTFLVNGSDENDSNEGYTLDRNGFPIIRQDICHPTIFIHYNPLTETQYNLLNEEDFNKMEE